MLMDRDSIVQFSGDAPIHTDDNSLLEFNAPKYIYRDERDVLVRQLTPFIKVDNGFIKFSSLESHQRASVLEKLSTLDRSESQVAEIKRHARIDQLLDMAVNEVNSGDPVKALGYYEDILKMDPEHVMTYFNLGNVFNSLSRYEEAERAYQKTLSLNPYYVFGSVALSKLYISTRRPQQAVEVLEKVLEWYVGDSEVRLYLGLAYSLQKNSQRAVEEMEKALQLDSGNY